MNKKQQEQSALVTHTPRVPEPSGELILAISRLPPRNLVKVEENILAYIRKNPALARKCVYCKPVGKRGNIQQFAMGASIRFAEVAHQHFERLWARQYVVEETPWQSKKVPGTVTTETVVFDLHSMNITSAMDTSPVYGETLRDTARDRSFAMSRRDALLGQVRPQYEAIESEIMKTVVMSFATGEKKTEQGARLAMWGYLVKKFSEYSVSKEQLNDKIEFDATTNGGYCKLLGILAYLNNGNADKVNEVFRAFSKPPVKKCEDLPPEPAGETAADTAAEETGIDAQAQSEPSAARAEFNDRVLGLTKPAGITPKQITDLLMAEFGVMGGLGNVPEADFDRVHDFFLAKSEGSA